MDDRWYNSWSWNSWHDDWQRQSANSAADTTEWSKGSLPEIIPDFIHGWYLFVDSGLDVMERNALQAELRGDFSVKAVEDVLRKHWGDHDLKKRDQEKGKYQANVAELYGDEEEQAWLGEWDPERLESEGFSGDEIAAMAKEQEIMHEACAAIQEARRTLKDARARQHAVRTARQFYPVRPRDSSSSASANFSGIKPMKLQVWWSSQDRQLPRETKRSRPAALQPGNHQKIRGSVCVLDRTLGPTQLGGQCPSRVERVGVCQVIPVNTGLMWCDRPSDRYMLCPKFWN